MTIVVPKKMRYVVFLEVIDQSLTVRTYSQLLISSQRLTGLLAMNIHARWRHKLAQDRAGWLKLVTEVPFDIGKPQLRPPRCDTRVTPEEKRSFF